MDTYTVLLVDDEEEVIQVIMRNKSKNTEKENGYIYSTFSR